MLTYFEPFMNKTLFLLLSFALSSSLIFSQQLQIDTLTQRAEKARIAYKFNEAVQLLKEAAAITNDSLLKRTILSNITKCENGKSMLDYGVNPKVIGNFESNLKEFFLYYEGLSDSSWSYVPINLSGAKDIDLPISVVYLRGNENQIIFSGKNKYGRWKLYSTKKTSDNMWSYPSIIKELASFIGDEVFPFCSSDGKQLYFSSDGLYGMGGFDIYVSTLDSQTGLWGTPQNLGFPYSSPKNDYLFVHSDNGKYTYIASDRASLNSDSIRIYQLERDINPVKRSFSDYSEIIKIAALSVVDLSLEMGESEENKNIITDAPDDEYSAKVMSVRKIQSEIDSCIRTISSKRSLYQLLSNEADKKLMEKRIEQDELSLISLQSELRNATVSVQKSELEFLQKGVLVPRVNTLTADPIKKSPDSLRRFNPIKATMGRFPYITLKEQIQPTNFSFRIESNSAILPLDSIPSGIIFTIQLYTTSPKVDIKQLRGFSPIFKEYSPTGKIKYYCGAFSTYDAAATALVKIKSSGIPNASIFSFNNKSVISLKQAKTLAEQRDKNMGFRITLDHFYESGVPSEFLEIIRQNCKKDIIKAVTESGSRYFIGTFTNRSEAEKILSLLKSAGAEGVNIEEFKLQ